MPANRSTDATRMITSRMSLWRGGIDHCDTGVSPVPEDLSRARRPCHSQNITANCRHWKAAQFPISSGMLMDQPQPTFLDVPTLLEQSQPRGTGVRMWQVLGVFMLIVLGSAFL